MYDVNRELTELRKRVFDLEHTLAGFQSPETELQYLAPPAFIPWAPAPGTVPSPHPLGGPHHTGVGSGLERSGTNLQIDLCDAWSGLEFTGNELRVDLDAVHAWTADHAWDGDTLYVDVSEDAIYINAGTFPATRGALTLQPATTGQRGLVLKRPWDATTYNANLLAIIDENDDLLIVMTKAGDLESGTPGFVSGQQGWQITYDGNAEFNNLFVRGELHAVTFVADEMHATGGTLAVMTASKVAEPIAGTDNKLPAALNDSFTLVVQASWDTGLCYVAISHILRIKTMAEVAAGGSLDLWDIWLEVDETPSSNGDRDLANGEPGTYDVTCVWRQGGETDVVIPTGAAAVHWGTLGTEKGGLILTSDLNYSPYMDIFTIPDASPWSAGTTPHVRVGNLDGVLSLDEEWGIAAGKNLALATEPHIVMSDQRLRLWGVAQRWWDTSGNTRGEIDPSAGPTDVLFWLGPSEAGAHFKVLGSGDVWLDTLAISGDLGDFLFSKADGLLLLGPNCEINATEWWSLRRQKATLSGAFHQAAGRWLGTRGLVIEKGITNCITNPSTEVDTTGWVASIGDETLSRHDFSPSIQGNYGLKVIINTGGAHSAGVYRVITGETAASTQYTISVWLCGDAGEKVCLWLYDGVGGNQFSGDITLTSQWVRHTFTATFSTGGARYCGILAGATEADTFTFYADGVQVETGPTSTSYCDGSLDWCSWTGTAHASTSARVATQVALASYIGHLETVGSISAWVKFPWDANDGLLYWLVDCNYTAGLIICKTSAALGVWVGGTHRINYAVNTTNFASDTWHHLMVTYNASATVLYLDGVLVCSGGGGTPTLSGNIEIGSYTGGYYWNGELGEIATFSNVLSATEAAAIFALQRPLVDAGAMDSPGIYILDGKFKMASSLTGNRIQIDAEEIAGYDSSDVKQFYLRSSDGAAYAGGGAVRLNADGLQIVADSAAGVPEKIRFLYDDAGVLDLMGNVYADWAGGAHKCVTWLISWRQAGDPWPAGVSVVLAAVDTIAGTDVRLAVNSSQVVDVTGENIFRVDKLLRPGRIADAAAEAALAAVEDGCLIYRQDTDELRLRANGAWVSLN